DAVGSWALAGGRSPGEGTGVWINPGAGRRAGIEGVSEADALDLEEIVEINVVGAHAAGWNQGKGLEHGFAAGGFEHAIAGEWADRFLEEVELESRPTCSDDSARAGRGPVFAGDADEFDAASAAAVAADGAGGVGFAHIHTDLEAFVGVN